MTTVALRRDYRDVRDHAWESTALGPEVLAWLDWLDVADRAERTLDQYERDLSRLCYRVPSKKLADITDADCLHVVMSWPKPSRRTRSAALRSFFKWAYRTERIDKNPMDKLPDIARPGQKVFDIFTEAEIDDLLSLPLIDGALMAILIEGGLRKADARKLQVRRLRLEPVPQFVLVGGKGNKDRLVPMFSRVHDLVRELLLFEGLDALDYLWYTKPGGKRIQRERQMADGSFDFWWRRCVEAAGVRYRNPHMTRHTFATRWLRRGGRLETLSRAMGHASLSTTFDLYGHLNEADIAADIALMESV